jgi:hypothetical protein
LTCLQRCRFGLDTLDALVMIYKNWPNNAQTNCKLIEESVTKFFCAEDKLLMNMKRTLGTRLF